MIEILIEGQQNMIEKLVEISAGISSLKVDLYKICLLYTSPSPRD